MAYLLGHKRYFDNALGRNNQIKTRNNPQVKKTEAKKHIIHREKEKK